MRIGRGNIVVAILVLILMSSGGHAQNRTLGVQFFLPGGTLPQKEVTFTRNPPGMETFTSDRTGKYSATISEGVKEIRFIIPSDKKSYGLTTIVVKLIPGLNSYPIFLSPLEFDLESMPASTPEPGYFDEKVPPEAKAIFEGALQSAKTRSMGSTISDLTKALSLYPQYMRLLNYLGLQYFNNERYDEASAAFIQALTISHKYPTGLINLGSTYNRQGKFNQAVAVLNYLVNAYPDFTIARLPLADALTRAQQWDEAGEQLRMALADKNLGDSPRAEAHLLLSRVLVREERYIGAKAELEKAIAAKPDGPNVPEAWLMLANVLVQMKKPEEAEQAFILAYEKGGKRLAIAQFQLGQLYYDMQKYDQSLRSFEKYVADVPSSANLPQFKDAYEKTKAALKK